MWEELRAIWPLLTSLVVLAFTVGLWVQQARSLSDKAASMASARAKEDEMRDKSAADREARIRSLEARPLPGSGIMCAAHQDKITEYGVTVREIRNSLRRIEKKLDIGNGEEE